MNTFDLTKLKTNKPTLILSVFGAAIDWGYKDYEAENPKNVPYFCELTAVWEAPVVGAYIEINTHGIIYPVGDTDNKFIRWDMTRFETHPIANADCYDLVLKQDNTHDFSFYCMTTFDNYAAISQTAADELAIIADDLDKYLVNIQYSNGMIELIGFEAP